MSLLLQSGSPLIQLWFGNFFEPWLSDQRRMAAALAEIRAMGFNAINLDSKAWADFFARYRGEQASQYVAMQEYMMTEAHRLGMGHSFLAIYLCGDNLYPALRDAPPVHGEDAIGIDGQSLNTYKYWSDTAQATMLEHVTGLLRCYEDGYIQFVETMPDLPVQTMFDPIVKPSFDDEGRVRYLAWLADRYGHDIGALNQRYAINVTSFDALTPQEYWLAPEALDYCGCAIPDEADFTHDTPTLRRWQDNQTWLAEETVRFFAVMQEKYRTLSSRIFLCPVLQQWGMFFPPPGNRWWDSGCRAIDPFRIAPHVDSALFIAAPLNPENDPDPYALSAELSIMRNANAGRHFLAGLFMGQHTHADLYRAVSPAEVIGTAALHGAAGLHIYGYGGADDGGVLQQMDSHFKVSLTTGNRWAAHVLPRVAGLSRLRDAAILFPRATQLYEPMLLPQGQQHRMDVLGWYRQLADLGVNVDIVHPDQVCAGALHGYRLLVLPEDACYGLDPSTELEAALTQWVQGGGVCIHGPGNLLAQRAFHIAEEPVHFDCIAVNDYVLIPQGWATVAFPAADPVAVYQRLGHTAIGMTAIGEGRVVSVGFPYGYASATKHPACPHGYSREEAHGVSLLGDDPVRQVIRRVLPNRWQGGRGVEAGWFTGGVVVVNHRTMPVSVSSLMSDDTNAIWQIEAGDGMLIPHSAVFLSQAT